MAEASGPDPGLAEPKGRSGRARSVRRFLASTYIREGEHFHFAQKRIPQDPPRYLHDHDYFELFLVTRGVLEHYSRSDSVRLEQGCLAFVRPEDAHALRADGTAEAEIVNVIFGADTAQFLGQRYRSDFAGRFFWRSGADPETHRLSDAQFERAIRLARELQFGRNSLVRIEEFLLSLMSRILDRADAADRDVPRWLVRACRAARDPAVFRRGAAGFVLAAGRGHAHVCRASRKHLGRTPTAYVNERRMEHAALLLGGSDLPVESVSHQCGIGNLSHFYRLFRRQFGMTPRRYRSLNQRNPVLAR